MPQEPLTAPGADVPALQAEERDIHHVVTLDVPAEVLRVQGGAARTGGVSGVHVAPDIVRQVLTPERVASDRERRDLDAVVHQVLIIGLALSTALMLAGVGLELARGTALPATVAGVGEVLPRALALRPSGVLTLGLLVLIATPILRVVGSVVAFIVERDWRFAGVTALVLLVMVVSILLGKG
jgi:uncharacterized membrane protein